MKLTEERLTHTTHIADNPQYGYDVVILNFKTQKECKKIKTQILQNQRLRELIEEEQKHTLVFGTSESVNQMDWKQEFVKRLLEQSKENKS